ncbi:MAG: guanylate kinase [Syntrophales bacterium]|nr:guanylate kinase [Syntrophales bacterium]
MNDATCKKQPGLLMVVSAPSGAGKTSICREILRRFPNIRFSVSCTTRPPRRGEISGRDYEFISRAEFRERMDRGEFVEWVENYGHLYGTSKKTMDAFLSQGYDMILDIEPRGAKAIREHYPQGVFIFILPPSYAELKSRLSLRGESPPVMERRLRSSLDEIREALWYDYVIFNETLEEAVDRFRAVYIAEMSRRDRWTDRIEAFLKEESS